MLKKNRYTIAFAFTFLSGCVYPSLPPPRSSANYIRNENVDGQMGSISITAGPSILTGNGNPNLVLFPNQGSITFTKKDSYYLSVTTRSGLILAYEGNYKLIGNEHLRLGILHGTGIGSYFTLPIESQSFNSTLWWDLDAGLMLEIRPERDYALHGCFRYTVAYAGAIPLTALVANDSISHYFEGVFGFTKFIGRIGIGPEAYIGYQKVFSIDNINDNPSDFDSRNYNRDAVNIGVMFTVSSTF